MDVVEAFVNFLIFLAAAVILFLLALFSVLLGGEYFSRRAKTPVARPVPAPIPAQVSYR